MGVNNGGKISTVFVPPFFVTDSKMWVKNEGMPVPPQKNVGNGLEAFYPHFLYAQSTRVPEAFFVKNRVKNGV